MLEKTLLELKKETFNVSIQRLLFLTPQPETFTSLPATYMELTSSPASAVVLGHIRVVTLSLGVDLLKCMLYPQVGSPGDSPLLSHSTRGTLPKHTGALPSSLSCFLTRCCSLQMSTFVLNKKSYCFCLKKKKKRKWLRKRPPLNALKETSTPPLCLIESNGR